MDCFMYLHNYIILYDPLFLAAHLLNLRSFLKMHLQKPKGCQNNRQTLYYNRLTFCANPSAHLKLPPLFLPLGGATKSRCFHSSQWPKRAKIGLWHSLDAKTIKTIDLNKFSAFKSVTNGASVCYQSKVRKDWKACTLHNQFCAVSLPDCSEKNAFLLWQVLLKNAPLWRNACANRRKKLIEYCP